jgi:hypothetical protein
VENFGASQNLGEYTEFMRLVACDRTMANVEISAPGKISAPSQSLSGKVWRPLTIWAQQNLPLLTSSCRCVLVTDYTPHACSPLSQSSFSYLRSAVEASFDIKRLVWSRTSPIKSSWSRMMHRNCGG